MSKIYRLTLLIIIVLSGIIEGIANSIVDPDSTKKVVAFTMPAYTVSTTSPIFSFDKIDSQIEALLSQPAIQNQIAAATSPPPSEFSKLMVDIGTGGYAAKLKKVDHIIDHAISIGKKISQLASGDLVSLPLIMEKQIGQNTIQIIFNSAKIYSKFAEIEVYIKIEVPQKDFEGKPVVLFFGADDIRFSSEKGIISGSVGLLADYTIKMGDSGEVGLYLTKMEKTLIEPGNPYSPLDDEYRFTGTFINFDCDGFKEMGVGGKIYFSREWLTPTNEFGEPLQVNNDNKAPNPIVKGEFQIIVQDWSDWLIENLSITHFRLKKWDKLDFYLGNANLDFSSKRNPLGIPYPHVAAAGNEWEGVYIQSISITMPKPFKRNNSSLAGSNQNTPPSKDRIKISAEHLLIDEIGVFGEFSIKGQAPLIGGPIMNGEWGWSLDSIGITLAASEIVKFGCKGGLGVPILAKDGPLKYECEYNKVTDTYTFDVEKKCKKKFPIWNVAQADITNVGITMTYNNTTDEFLPEVSFWGSLSIGNPNDYASSQQGSSVKMPKISFSKLTLRTVQPYFEVEKLTVDAGGAKAVGFPVTVSNPTLTNTTGNEYRLSFDLIINLMDAGGGVSATGNIAIIGKYNKDLNWTKKLEFDRLEFGGATVIVNLPQFYAKGQLCIFEDDPVYGKGFSAGVNAKVIGNSLATSPGKFNITLNAIFGSTQGYRYWLVDGFVQFSSTPIPIVPGVLELNGFGGGAFHHMKPSGYDEAAANGQNSSCSAGTTDYCGIIYKPAQDTKLGIKFSTAFTAKGGILNGLLTCILRFGKNYALQNITFWGTADLMIPSKISESVVKNIKSAIPDNVLDQEVLQKQNKAKLSAEANKIKANLGISLDFENSFTFHAFAEVKMNIADVVHGSGSLDILASDKEWHFYLGGYYDGSVTVPGFFDNTPMSLAPVSVGINYGGFSVEANAYFLTGNKIPGPPPPHPQVVQFFGAEGSSNNRDKLNSCAPRTAALGTGVAFGASAFINFNKMKKGLFGSCVGGWKVGVGGGLGFDLALLKYDNDDQCGKGQPIGGINGMRATGRVFVFINIEKGHVTCIPLPHLGIGAKLRFDVIKPSYFQGVFVLDFIKKITLKADFGEECGTPCSGPAITN